MSKFSLNNRIVVEAHKTDKSLRAKVSNGFATVEQKTGLIGLKVIMDVTLTTGQHTQQVKRGDIAYVREELLHTAPWAQKALETADVGIPFFILDQSVVEFIDNREGELR